MLEAAIPPTPVEPVISISFPICNPWSMCVAVTVASPEFTLKGLLLSFFLGTEALCNITSAAACLNRAWCITKVKSWFCAGVQVTPFCE